MPRRGVRRPFGTEPPPVAAREPEAPVQAPESDEERKRRVLGLYLDQRRFADAMRLLGKRPPPPVPEPGFDHVAQPCRSYQPNAFGAPTGRHFCCVCMVPLLADPITVGRWLHAT